MTSNSRHVVPPTRVFGARGTSFRPNPGIRLARIITPVLGLLTGYMGLAGPLHEAIRSRDVAEVIAVIAADPQTVRDRDQDADTVLHSAVRTGSTHIVDALLFAGAEVNVVNKNGVSPRRLAEGLGRHEIAARIRDRGGLSVQEGTGSNLENPGRPASAVVPSDLLFEPAIMNWRTERRRDRGHGSLPDQQRFAKAVLPTIGGAVRPGHHQIRIHNPTPHVVEVGIRCGILGRNLVVASGGTSIARVASGYYDLFFAFGDGSGQLWKGDPVRLSGEGNRYEVNTITLTKASDGNYSLRPIDP